MEEIKSTSGIEEIIEQVPVNSEEPASSQKPPLEMEASIDEDKLEDCTMPADNVEDNKSTESDFDFLEVPVGVEEIEVTSDEKLPEQEWMDIIGSGDLKKKVITPGIVESRPSKGDTAVVEVMVMRAGGEMVQDRHTLTFTLGDSEVIPGVELVVPLMDRGEKSLIYIASRFAYADKGETSLGVAADTPLEVEMTLLDFSPEVAPLDLAVTERQAIGHRKRTRGNWWFSRADYSEAVMCYKAAVDFLDDTEGGEARGEVRELLEERLKALNNMAAAQLKLTVWEAALVSLRQVLACEPRNVKALFRKAKALKGQGKLAEALEPLRTALEEEPTNSSVRTLLGELTMQIKHNSESEKTMYRRMLGIKKEKEQSDPRAPLNMKPWKTFGISFVSLAVLGIAYSCRDQLYSLVQQ